MSNQSIIAKETQICAPNYHPLPIVLERGEGVWVFDVEGKRYLDMMSAYSAVSHGHCHPRLVAALCQQAKTLAVCSRAFHAERLSPFLEKLCEISGFEMALPMNTGAEAVETAIKAARRWGYRTKKIKSDHAEIIVVSQNFHGRTTTIISFSSEDDYKQDFGPLTPGFKIVPFADKSALENAITPNTCAVLMEPIQGEAGIVIPYDGYLKDVRELCDKHNVLMLLDEIQSGLGRTGKNFAFEYENIRPDGLILGKALGGGLLPVSAFLSSRAILNLMNPGSHGSTFGGNPLAARVALEGLLVFEEEHLAQKSYELGRYFMEQLKTIKHAAIKDIRGKGLWIGVEFDPNQLEARKVAESLMSKGVLTKETHHTVIRLAPPLVITKTEIDWMLDIWRDVLSGF